MRLIHPRKDTTTSTWSDFSQHNSEVRLCGMLGFLVTLSPTLSAYLIAFPQSHPTTGFGFVNLDTVLEAPPSSSRLRQR
jgi:hypothetical protein